MSTETVLTDERIFALGAEIDITSIDPKVDVLMFSRDEFLAAGRAIEQAVLQTPEVQAWRRDSARLDYWKVWWMRSEDDDGQLPPDVEKHLENLDFDEAFDAAMEKQP